MTEYFNTLWNHWGKTLLAASPKIVGAIIVLVIALMIDDRARHTVENLLRRRGHRELGRLLGRLVRLGILLLGLLVVLGIFQQTGIVASFIASLGIVGLIIAFALQDITKQFAAGVLLLVQRPFRLDDRIKVGAFEGTVTDISLRAIALHTADGHEVLIPNADVYSGAITNLTRYPQRRITVPFVLPATLDPLIVLPRLESILRETPGLSHDAQAKPPTIAVVSLGKEDINCEARFWVPAANDTTALITAATVRLHQALAVTKKD